MGSESWVTVEVNNERLIARAPADFQARTGDTLGLRYDARWLHRFDTASGQRR
jgi:multiple sugar transport system ATP-binding protein